MTREEAIEILKNECYVFNPMNFDRTTLINTALDMAIKALEQEPCDDAVSRNAIDQNIYDYAKSHRLSYANMANYILDVPPITPTRNQEPVLDKIRAEIKDNRDDWIKGQDPEWHTYDRCLYIIDKYKAESEGE